MRTLGLAIWAMWDNFSPIVFVRVKLHIICLIFRLTLMGGSDRNSTPPAIPTSAPPVAIVPRTERNTILAFYRGGLRKNSRGGYGHAVPAEAVRLVLFWLDKLFNWKITTATNCSRPTTILTILSFQGRWYTIVYRAVETGDPWGGTFPAWLPCDRRWQQRDPVFQNDHDDMWQPN